MVNRLLAVWRRWHKRSEPDSGDDPSEVSEANDVSFSRGIAGPLGKVDCPLATKVDQTTFELFRRDCALSQTDTATVLRDFVYMPVHGKTYRQMVAEKLIHDDKRIDAMRSLIGSFRNPESAVGSQVAP